MTSTTHKIKENRYESLKTRNRTSPTKPLDSNTRFYQKSDYEHIQDCKEHMMRNGFDYRGEIKVNTNGKFKRFSIDENKTKKDEFYMSLNGISSKGNTFFYCTYGSWKSGEKYTYKSWENSKDRNSINKLSEEEIKAIEKQHKEDIEKANEKKKKEQAQVAEHAKNIWGQSKDQAQTTEHLYYLEKKGVKNYGLRFGYYPKGNEKYPVLVVPIKNINGEIRTLQYIFKDENDEIQKRFLKNGEKTGNYYVIGEIKHNELFYVCEGYATAASVYEAIQKPVVVALDSNNLNLVIENLRSIYPKNEIIIAADKDKNEVGQNKAKEAASKYNCKVILPNFKEKAIDEKNTDFNDLHTAFGLEEVKRQLIDEPEYFFIPDQKQNKIDNLPVIKITPGEIHIQTDSAERLLAENNSGIYQRSGRLVRIIESKNKPKDVIKRPSDALIIIEVDQFHLTEILSTLGIWEKFDTRTGRYQQKDCPEKISKTLMSRKTWDKISVLSGVIQAPTIRYDGSILDVPGYDKKTGLYFHQGDTRFPSVPINPSRDDADLALQKILYILKGFPFENETDRSVAISAILTALIRKSFKSAPIHGFTAPKMGSGKSLLADCVGLISTGKANCVISQSDNEIEEKKRILAVLSEGDSIICYDNIERPFGSPALCSILTQEEYKDRVLCSSQTLNVSTQATFLATGNNLTFVGDISTRAIMCRLDPKCEHPEERLFDVDLPSYILQHRGEIVQACLIMIRAYLVAGSPKQSFKQFGRFEDWSNIVRSTIVWLGLADPCTSRKEIEMEDPTRLRISRLYSAWYAVFGDVSMTLKNVLNRLKETEANHDQDKLECLKDILTEIALDSKGNVINTRSLGKSLGTYKGRIENGLRLEKSGTYQNSDTWRVVKIN